MSDWPSREEILGGLPARRAWTLLFLIESTAASRVRLLREAGTELASERNLESGELAELEAFALGREPAEAPTIQELEQTAEGWAEIVPANPRLRAAVAALLGRRHEFTRSSIPNIRRALGLDEEDVHNAFASQQGADLDTIYASGLSLRSKLAFTWSAPATWLERAPVQRSAAILTFSLAIGQPLLALPLTLALCGPAIGLAVVAALGLFSVFATAATAEAVARSGEVRHRGAFFGRLVTSLLGRASGAVPVALTVVRGVLSILAAFIGLSLTFAAGTPVPEWAWAALALVAILVLIVGQTRSASLGTLMVIGLGTAAILFGLGAATIAHTALGGDFDIAASLGAGGIDPGLVGYAALIGVALETFVNPIYTVQFARVLLPRDPEGTSFIRGSIIGSSWNVVMVICFGLLIALGLPHADLGLERSTVLVPIADQATGPIAIVADRRGVAARIGRLSH